MNLATKTQIVKAALIFLITFCGLVIAAFVTGLVIGTVGWLLNTGLPAINDAIVALPMPVQLLAWCAVAAVGITGVYVIEQELKAIGVALKHRKQQ